MKAITPERLFWLAAAAALASIGLAGEPLLRRLRDGAIPRPPASAPEAAPEPELSLDPILSLAPFGRAEPEEAPAPDAGKTALDLTLHGVVIAAPTGSSRAIVSGGAEPPQAYAPGDRIAGTATLVAVERDRIVLAVDGRRETLLFSDPASPSGPNVPHALAPVGPPLPEIATPAPSNVALAIAEMRERFRDNPYRVLEDLGLEATEAGYRVGPGAAEAVRRAGLRPGDVVDKINGQPVGNVELDRRFFDAVAATGQARVELVRGAERVVMSFPLQ